MFETNQPPSPAGGSDRRAEPRVPASRLGDVSLRLVGGGDLTLLNYAATSLYGRSPSRLLVGARLSVRLATATMQAVVAGRVVRSSLTAIVDGVPRYEIAVSLDRPVDWASAAEEAELTFEADDPSADLESSLSP
jgi:hypothetical protein